MDFDVLVIGGGSAGFAAARVAAECGARVALVEGGPIGGLCILEGCMPSKALLHPAATLHRVRTAGALGVRCAGAEGARLDFDRVMARKRALVAEFAAARREELEGTPGLTLLRGRARFTGPLEVAVRPQREEPRRIEEEVPPQRAPAPAGGQAPPPGDGDGERRYRVRKVVIATGSYTCVPPVPGIEEAGYITSADALDLPALPESVVLLGGGPVGLELGQFYARAGSRVTLLEKGEALLEGADPRLSDALTGALRAGGMEIHTGATVQRCARRGGERLVRAEVDGEQREMAGEVLLVASGRQGRVAELDLERAGVAVDGEAGTVRVDGSMQTSHPDVYAAGDVASRQQATHLAVLQGEVAGYNAAAGLGLADPRRPFHSPAAQRLGGVASAGPDGRLRVDESVVPRVLYTDPAYGQVGMGEQEAREAGIDVAVAHVPFAESGMARVMGETAGAVTVVARREDGRILGVEILGHQAETLIREAVLALAFGATAEALARIPCYHPTLSEVLVLPAEKLAQETGPATRP